MKNTLVMLLIATMGMFTTHASAESKQNFANSCVKLITGQYDEYTWGRYMKNNCNRPVNVGVCYETSSGPLPSPSGDSRCGSRFDPVNPRYAHTILIADKYRLANGVDDIVWGACFDPYYPFPVAGDGKSYSCVKCTVETGSADTRPRHNGKLCDTNLVNNGRRFYGNGREFLD